MIQSRSISIFGATGSIGDSTINVIAQHPDRFRVSVLTAHRNVGKLATLAEQWKPQLVVIGDEDSYTDLKQRLAHTNISVAAGNAGMQEAAAIPTDLVMNAIVGFAGLLPMMTAIEHGATIALANKEALVCAGTLVMEKAAEHGATILPVDSEHNAIFQAMQAHHRPFVETLTLTASGGPFRGYRASELKNVTPKDALNHPNWDMGNKITIDSATLMNKGLELIEACHLFTIPPTQVDIVVHPQSVIHSLAHFNDGSVLAQLGEPDMRIPIAYCLGWPERIPTDSPRLNLAEIARLDFETPDYAAFPAPLLCRNAFEQGGTAPTILNAANEIAVSAFLSGSIGFPEITECVEKTLSEHPVLPLSSIEDVQQADESARHYATDRVNHGKQQRQYA